MLLTLIKTLMHIWHEIMQTDIWPQRMCIFFFQRQGWETYFYAPVVKNKSFSWKYGYKARQKKQKKYFFSFWGVHTDPPPTWGPPNFGHSPTMLDRLGGGVRMEPPKSKKIFFLYFLSSPIPIFSGKTFIFSNRCIKIGFPTLSLKQKFNIRWGQMSGSIISCHVYRS